MEKKIDFVVLWVDGNDPEFIREKNKYTPYIEQSDNDEDNLHRYRDYGTFNYWFRMVERHAPWVNNIYLITNGQRPKWLNVNHPKLKWVRHEDFIPEEYLPTFNSSAIEMNIHRIDGLSENFVLFNDDMYLIQDVKYSDFFVNEKPKLLAVYEALVPWSSFSKIYFNDVLVLYRHFPNKKALRQSPFKFFNIKYGQLMLKNILLLPWKVTGYYNQHIPVPIKKSTLAHLWNLEEDVFIQTSKNKFRDYNTDINHYLLCYWQIESNDFIPSSKDFGKSIPITAIEELPKLLLKKRTKLLCVNDDMAMTEDDLKKFSKILSERYPEKSQFEL